MERFFYKWGPVILWAGVIFTLSSIPTFPKVAIIWWDFILKKSAHVIEYGIFYFLLIRALSVDSGKRLFPQKVSSKVLLYALAIAIIYALSDEYHQSFTPGRTPKITDVGFDTLGMIISGILIRHKQSSSK